MATAPLEVSGRTGTFPPFARAARPAGLSGDVASLSQPPSGEVVEPEAQPFQLDLVGAVELAGDGAQHERRSPVFGYMVYPGALPVVGGSYAWRADDERLPDARMKSRVCAASPVAKD
jgi:hypothetical protein